MIVLFINTIDIVLYMLNTILSKKIQSTSYNYFWNCLSTNVG